MPLTVSCNACKKQFQVPDHYAGRAGKCTQCGAPMVAPAAPAMTSSGEAAFSAPTAAAPAPAPVALSAPPVAAAPAAAGGEATIGGALGPYKLIRKLGDAKSSVFLAEGPKGPVALKVLPEKMTSQYPTAAKRFLREARSLFGLSHPNVPAILDAGEELGSLYIAMELFDGAKTIKQVLEEKKRLPANEALAIAAQAARGIGHLDSHKLVHRNIKPEHLLIDGAGTVKLAGLGLIKGAEDQQALTVRGHVVGTPQYLSPEMARGEQEVDSSTDLWSLGVTLYELLAGEVPWNDKNPMKVLQAITNTPHPPLAQKAPGTPPPIVAVVDKLLAKEKAQRYASPEELATDLAAIEEGTLVAGKPPSFSKGQPGARGAAVAAGGAPADAAVKKLVVLVGVLVVLVVALIAAVAILVVK